MNMFEFFFKYRPIVYEKGRLSFQLLSSRWLFIPLALIAIGVADLFLPARREGKAVAVDDRAPLGCVRDPAVHGPAAGPECVAGSAAGQLHGGRHRHFPEHEH